MRIRQEKNFSSLHPISRILADIIENIILFCLYYANWRENGPKRGVWKVPQYRQWLSVLR